jgi:hypothetical protein
MGVNALGVHNAFFPLYVNPCGAGFTEIGAPPGKGLIPIKPYY